MPTSPHAFALIAVLAAGLTACTQEGAEEETAPADTTAAVEAHPDVAHEMTYTLVVTNPMPHAMNVTATMADGNQVQLGTVAASGEGSFSVTGTSGESVTVTATDDANTHSPTGNVTLPESETMVRWTVE